MTDIDVACTPAGDGWSCRVILSDEGGSTTEHTVSVSRGELDRYAAGTEADVLVSASLRFLLEREPKQSILRRFALSDIERYFPEYGREIGAQLAE